MPGIQDFTFANYGKETTRGTPVPPTRKFYAEGTGVLDHDLGVSFHEAENAGYRTRVRRATPLQEDVALKLATADGLAWDDLTLPLTQLKGGLTGTGAGADKTWTCTPSLTGQNAPEAFSWDVGDDTQAWRVQYGMATKITLSAAKGDWTQMALELFGQRAIKGAAATPANTAGPKIAGELWQVKFATTLAGLAGASVVTNFLLDWKLELSTGLSWQHYQDGNLFGSQHVETTIGGVLTMTVDSTAQAVSQFYDKYVAGTLDFIRLQATGPALGGSAYSAQLNLPVIYDKPSIIDSDRNGINQYKITAKLATDSPTAATQSISAVVVNSLAAIP